MPAVKDFLSYLSNSNIELESVDGQLRVTAPKGAITPEIQAIFKQNKQAVLACLPPAGLQAPMEDSSGPPSEGSGVFRFTFSASLSGRIAAITSKTDASSRGFLPAALGVLLYRYDGQNHQRIGLPRADKFSSSGVPLYGCWDRIEPLILNLAGNPPFSEVLNRLTAADPSPTSPPPGTSSVLDQQNTPASKILFNFREVPDASLSSAGRVLRPLEVPGQAPGLELEWILYQFKDGLAGLIHYDPERYRPEAIARMAGHLTTLLTSILDRPDQPIEAIPILTPEEEHRLLVEFNDTARDYPKDKCVHRLFEEQAARSPQDICLEYGDEHLTYDRLNRRSNQLARYLIRQGLEPDQLVGICLQRSPEMIVALLGVLKAGGAYVPLDAAYPRKRLEFILEDAQIHLLLTTSDLKEKYGAAAEIRALCLDTDLEGLADESEANPQTRVTPDHLCYVIYTSGSTGRPKGAMIAHRGLVNYLWWALDYYQVGAGSGAPVHSPFGFDATITSIYTPLLAGKKIVLLPEREEIEGLKQVIQAREGYSLIKLTPAHLDLLDHMMAPGRIATDAGVLILGGEQLLWKSLETFRRQAPHTRIVNEYGPTETVVGCCIHEVKDQPAGPGPVPIGRPIANTRLYILDAHLRPVPEGVAGELFIAGDGVGRGYLNRPDLTQERFIPDPFSGRPQLDGQPGSLMYKTGDLARYLPDGNMEYLGRIDHQVKIRGYRIELGEIETQLLDVPGIREAVVVSREDTPGDKRLVGYLVVKDREAVSLEAVRDHLKKGLPDYMIPSALVILDRMPLNANGKVDRRSLPRPEGARPDLAAEYVKPRTDTEKKLAGIWRRLLRLDRVGVNDNFFELGGHSLLAVQSISLLKREAGLDIPITRLFQHPNIGELADFIDGRTPGQPRPPARRVFAGTADGGRPEDGLVAIVGLAGRYPGAATIPDLWKNICDGIDSIQFFTDAELDPSILAEQRSDPDYVRAKGVIEGADRFDASFFGINPREAELMDPQHRVFLETAWEALENAGHVPESFPGAIGVYGGTGYNTYFRRNVLTRPDRMDALGEYQTMVVNEKDYLATRTSYLLNLSGPSISLYTACSTSLVAVCQAVKGLMSGECDLALAGGVNISAPLIAGYTYQEGGMVSPDGHCRPFDINAAGTVFNDGIGLVVLRRLPDALADHDRVWAVIRGAAVNNDGSHKVSFTAPSVEGQADVITRAQEAAGVDPATITYLEAHGTATPLGDPIEIEALTQAFRAKTDEQGFCGLGSIKSNIGHTVTAAGAAGLIKTALSLYHQTMPPTAHFTAPNPKIDFSHGPFYVVDRLTPWPAGKTPRRAGVSSFGVGGTNAHVVLEEAPAVKPSGPSRPGQVLLLSARTDDALDTAADNLARHLEDHPEQSLADLAFTLQTGRQGFTHRRFLVCRDHEEAAQVLRTRKSPHTAAKTSDGRPPDIVFMFPGQGVQYVNMGLALYQDEPVFREQVDRCAEILQPALGLDLRESLYPEDRDGDHEAQVLKQTFFTQPAIFTIEFALAKLLGEWGVWPEAMIGHSIGEFTAACLAGVFSLEDALTIVAARGRLMQDQPPGSMLSVRLPADQVERLLDADLALAAINGPSLCVVSGPTDRVNALREELKKQKVAARPLQTSHAFHSPMMDPMVEPLADVVRGVSLSPPLIPILSTVTGDWMTPEEATDPMYWAHHARATVRFSEGIGRLWENPERVLLEVGPRKTSATLARQHAADLKKQTAISTLDDGSEKNAEWMSVLDGLGRLWLAGARIDWDRFYRREIRYRVPLPTYPFERRRFWLEPGSPDMGFRHPDETKAVPAGMPDAASGVTSTLSQPMTPSVTETAPQDRKDRLIPLIRDILEDISGEDLEEADPDLTFLELGFDSLLLTQVAMTLQKRFKVKITFRQLIDQHSSENALAAYLDQELPPDAFPPPVSRPRPGPAPLTEPDQGQAPGKMDHDLLETPPMSDHTDAPMLERIIGQQLQVMSRQLDMLRQGGRDLPALTAAAAQLSGRPIETQTAPAPAPTPPEREPGKAFGPGARIERTQKDAMSPAQRAQLDAFIDAYTARTKGSKAYAQKNRAHLADPRAVSGFTPALKELVYPIVVNRSSGSRLWDVDGNEYVDLLNGFGSNFFGYSPAFITEALEAQLKKGIEIGPQAELAGEVAGLINEFTGMERTAFCNTGSEAVLGVMRLARTVTGRQTIVIFNGSYHGIFDEVIVRPTAKGSMPGAPGIMPSAVENIMVLDWGDPKSLDIIKARASELAAVMVEPVQSRRPDLQPREFLHELRRITEASGTALIFDEVITGFRIHPGGAQAYYGLRADLATYGKVIGGGLPLGVLAGSRAYMDALDGGHWQFGDDSFPEVGVTYFAGTFVRHPLALAAAKAVLNHLKEKGPGFQEEINQRTGRLVDALATHFNRVNAPIKLPRFGSLFLVEPAQDLPYGSLLFHWLRQKGIHIWEHRPCFLTAAHSDADVDLILDAFKESVAEMQAAGFLPGGAETAAGPADGPPVPGAKLGRDPRGNPAWYVPDPERPGKYLQVDDKS